MIDLGGFIPDDEVSEELSDRINVEVDSSFYEATAMERSLYRWKIYYRFADGIRNNKPEGKSYGSEGVSFQKLFKFLVHLNSDINFIDNYILTVLPSTDINEDMDKWLSYIEESVIYGYSRLHKRKDGGLDRRYKLQIRDYINLTEELESEQEEHGVELSRRIRSDIVTKLETGSLPLDPAYNKYETKLRRFRANLQMAPRFFASGQFIKALMVTCRFEKRSESWNRDISV